MWRLVVLLVACRGPAPVPSLEHPTAPPPRIAAAAARPSRTVARLTPSELAGVVLGMSREDLARARPESTADPDGHVDFREQYVESIPGAIVHYYVLRDGSATYQISLDFDDEAAALQLWERYRGMGALIDDLGGREIVIEGYAFQVRAWTHGRRVQIMAVIEGSEWWTEYHGKDPLDGRPVDGDGDDGSIIP